MPTKTKQLAKGRPTELNPQTQAQICAALSLGVYLEAAAAFSGIERTTLYRWLKRGEEEPGIYRDFRNAVEEARGKKVLRYMQRIEQASGGADPDWRAAAWVLERTEPEHYSQHVKIDDAKEPPGKPSYRPRKKK